LSAAGTDMCDFIVAIERALPPLLPCAEDAIRWYLVEARSAVDDLVAVCELTGKICGRVVQELEFEAEDWEAAGYQGYARDAWRCRYQARRFAARFGQPCQPIRMVPA
jgi:hypothetical protein